MRNQRRAQQLSDALLGTDPPQARGGLVPAVVFCAVSSPEASGCVAVSLAARSSTPGDSWLLGRAVRNEQGEVGDLLPQHSAGVQRGWGAWVGIKNIPSYSRKD